MCQEEVMRNIAVPVLLQYCGNLVFRILLCIQFRVLDVVVAGDATVLAGLMLIGRSKKVHLVTVATIAAKHRSAEV